MLVSHKNIHPELLSVALSIVLYQFAIWYHLHEPENLQLQRRKSGNLEPESIMGELDKNMQVNLRVSYVITESWWNLALTYFYYLCIILCFVVFLFKKFYRQILFYTFVNAFSGISIWQLYCIYLHYPLDIVWKHQGYVHSDAENEV